MARTDPRGSHDDATEHASWPQLMAAMDKAITPCKDGAEWLSEDPWQQRRAAALCHGCQILAECRAFALIDRNTTGVWGGTTQAHRKRLRRSQHPRKEAA